MLRVIAAFFRQGSEAFSQMLLQEIQRDESFFYNNDL